MPNTPKDPTLKVSRSSPPTTPSFQPIDQPLTSLRRRQQSRRGGGGARGSRGALKWVLVGLVVLGIAGLIAAPLVYRSLRPEYRERIKHYAPFMSVFDPQREYTADTLPTVAPAEGGINPADLLLTPEVLRPASGGDAPSPTPAENNIIVITATPSPTDLPLPTLEATEIEATPIAVQPTVAQPTAALPTATWTPAPTVTPLPVTAVALLPAARLYGFTHIAQTWNNCGPATLTMGLSYFGWTQDQSVAASYLKPDPEDKNVSPGQMVRFVNNNTGVRALYRYGGDMDMIRRLVLEGFPVIVEAGFMPEGYDWMGHYKLVVAYDDALQTVYLFDSFLGAGENGQGRTVSYADFDRTWKHFNRVYIVLYEAARENDLRVILGDNADLTLNWQHALEVARQEASADPTDPFAWFNMGTSYVGLGMYEEAARAYDQARNAGSGLPWRMLWYQFGPYQAYFEVGRYDDVLALVQANLGTTEYVEETYYWMGMVYMARGQYGPARNQFNVTLQHNVNFDPAREAIAELDRAQASAGS